MLKRYCFVIIFLCDALVFHAQDEALLHKTYSQRVAPLLSFYQTGIRELDSISVFTRINNIKKLAVDNDDDDLLMEAALMRAHYFYYRQYFPASLLLPMMDSLKEQGVKRNKPWLVTRAETMMALYNFFYIKQYEAGFEHFQKMYGSTDWPTKELTFEQDLIDLGWHQKEFQRRRSFAYTIVRLDESQVLGCLYINPTTKGDYDASITMWVRASMLDKGLDTILFNSVKQWITKDWPFKKVAYPGRQIKWEEWRSMK